MLRGHSNVHSMHGIQCLYQRTKVVPALYVLLFLNTLLLQKLSQQNLCSHKLYGYFLHSGKVPPVQLFKFLRVSMRLMPIKILSLHIVKWDIFSVVQHRQLIYMVNSNKIKKFKCNKLFEGNLLMRILPWKACCLKEAKLFYLGT